MKLGTKKTIQRVLAILLVVVLACALVDAGNQTTYANTIEHGMVYCPNEDYIETKVEPDSNSAKANGLVHGKTLYILGEMTGTDGQLWYQVQYYTGSEGKTLNTAYCPANRVRLNKNMLAVSTGTANGDMTLWSCTKSFQYPALTTIPAGTKLYITESREDSGLWYRIYCDINGVRMYGWVESAGITVDAVPDLPTDATFEEQLRQAGFPESYIKPLAILHERYPNWIFNPVHTNLDWNTVIAEEAKGDRNLVSKNADDSMKSTTIENYDWYKNTWMPKDSGAWVSANANYIAWCMDPRNFFDATNIFMFERLNSGVALDAAGVATITAGTFMKDTVPDTDGTTLDYATAFVNIGIEKGVNAYHLAVRVRQEQGTGGTSPLISGTYSGYEGYFNYFNIGATGSTKAEVLENGIKTAKDKEWNSRYKSLQEGAVFLKQNYIDKGQNTLYFQKFNVVYAGPNNNKLYNHQYMQNVDAARSEASTMANAHLDLSKPLVFDIPVYLNMPETAVTFVASGNPNNYLSSLNVSGVSLSPSFDGAKTEYTAIVDASMSSVSVSATAVASTSKISGTGTYNLAMGNNVITVSCTAQNGDVKNYTITIVREELGAGEYTLTSDKYEKGDYITGVAAGTSVADFLAGFSCDGCTIAVVDANGAIVEGTVGTGHRLAVYVNGSIVEVVEIAVKGDISGDGTITIADLVRLNRHILGISTLSGSQLAAADVNRNGSVNIQDLVLVNRHILGISVIN